MTSPYRQGVIRGLRKASELFNAALPQAHCDNCKSPWRYDEQAESFIDPFADIQMLIEKIGK